MSLSSFFGFGKSKSNKIKVTETDRDWFEFNYNWLDDLYGNSQLGLDEVVISSDFFPDSFSSKKVLPENVIGDLRNLFKLDSITVSIQIHEDVRDLHQTPYEIEGRAFETETEVEDEHKYKIHIASSTVKNTRRLIYRLILEIVRIHLIEGKVLIQDSEEGEGNDTPEFILIASIYFGFGVPLSQNMTDTGMSFDGSWEVSWFNYCDLPLEVMTYGLAYHFKKFKIDESKYLSLLSGEFKEPFVNSVEFLSQS
jgi:hypothetical protein